MIALLRLLEIVQVLLELVLSEEGRGIDALQHLPLHIPTPIGSGRVQQLEVLEVRRIGHVRPAAQIDERPVGVGGKDLVGALEVGETLQLERIIHEQCPGVLQRHFRANEGVLLEYHLPHLGFEGRKVLGRERLLDLEVVIEAIVNGRTESDLRIGAQAPHGRRENMRSGVTQHGQRAWVLLRDDHERARAAQRRHEVLHLPVHRHRQ